MDTTTTKMTPLNHDLASKYTLRKRTSNALLDTPPRHQLKRLTPQSPVKRHSPSKAHSYNESPMKDVLKFTGYENNFNGYQCRFLHKDSMIVFKITVSNMIITKNESIAIFEMAEHDYTECWKKTQEVLMYGNRMGTELKNPFDIVLNDNGSRKPVFIRISPVCSFYCKRYMEVRACANNFERPPLGRSFTGRLAVVIKGIKFSRDGTELTPMMMVTQVLEIAKPEPENHHSSELDLMTKQCVLDEPAKPEDDTDSAYGTETEGY